MFSAMPRSMGGSLKPTTDALKSATERILKEQQAALQAKDVYSQKLVLAQEYTKRLETAYEQLISNNSSLRLKVSSDDRAVRELIDIVEEQKYELSTALANAADLKDKLSATEGERAELIASRDASEAAGKKLVKSLKQVSEEAETLRSQLEQAVQKCSELEERIQKAEDAHADQKKAAEEHTASLSSTLESIKQKLVDQTSLAASREVELTEHAAAVAQLQQQLQTSQNEAKTLYEKLSAKEDALSQLETSLAEAKSLNEKLAAEAEETAKRVESLQGELASVNEEHTALKDDHTTLQQTLQQEKDAAALRQEAAEKQHAAKKEAAEAALKKVRDEAEAAAAAAATAVEDALKEAQKELESATKKVKESAEQELAAERERTSDELTRITGKHQLEVAALAAERQKLEADLTAAADRQAASEKEMAALEHRLDEASEARRQAEAKASQTLVDLTRTQKNLNCKNAEAEGYVRDINELQDDLAKVKKELEDKLFLLNNISNVAGVAGKNGVSPAAPPPGSTAKQQLRSILKHPSAGKPASSTKRRAGASPAGPPPHSARQRVLFGGKPPVTRTLDHALNDAIPETEPQDEEEADQDFADFGGGGGDNGDWDGFPTTQVVEVGELQEEDGDDEGEEEDRSMAMVPVSRARSSQAAAAAAARRRQMQRQQQAVRQVRQPARAVVEEPDSESESDEEADEEDAAGYRQARGKAAYHRKTQSRATHRGVVKPSQKAAPLRLLVALHQPTKSHGAKDNGKRGLKAVQRGGVAKTVGRKEGGKHGLFGLFNGLSHASPDRITP